MAGCGNEEEISQAETAMSIEHNVIHSYSVAADIAKIADTLEELIADSDFIAEVKVKGVSSSFENDSILINTEITPEIIKTYKGEYNGNLLILCGGYMNYKEYANSSNIINTLGKPIDTSKFTEEELENGEIYFDWFNTYIPEVGDTLVYFGKEMDTGDYYITNSYQGLFRCDGDKVSNQAFSINNSGYTESIAEDLNKKFSKSAKISKFHSQVVEEKDVLSISKKDFVSKIDDIV